MSCFCCDEKKTTLDTLDLVVTSDLDFDHDFDVIGDLRFPSSDLVLAAPVKGKKKKKRENT